VARLTFVRVILSLVSLGKGLLLISAFLAGHRTSRLYDIFVITAAGTSVTGFLFSFQASLPASWLAWFPSRS
jgi:hypothetical protein